MNSKKIVFKPVDPIPKLKYGKEFLVGYVGTMSVQEGLDILLKVALYIKESGNTEFGDGLLFLGRKKHILF